MRGLTVLSLLAFCVGLVVADYSYVGCFPSQDWTFGGNDPDLLSCSVNCKDTFQGYFGLFQTNCACQSADIDMSSQVSLSNCDSYQGGLGGEYLSVYLYKPDAHDTGYSTNDAATVNHQYHYKGCYRYNNHQQGQTMSSVFDSDYHPFYNANAELDPQPQAKTVEQCAEVCSTNMDGLFGIYLDTQCFCQNIELRASEVVVAADSNCEGGKDSYEPSENAPEYHRSSYMKLYKYVKAQAPTPAPTQASTQAPTQARTQAPTPSATPSVAPVPGKKCARFIGPNHPSGPNNCAGPNNENHPSGKQGPNNAYGPNKSYGPSKSYGPNKAYGPNKPYHNKH